MKRKICLPQFIISLLVIAMSVGCLPSEAPRDRPLIEPIDLNAPPPPVEEIPRPDGQVFINAGFCACKAQEPAIFGDCGSYCANEPSANPNETRLFLNTTLGEEILLNAELGDLNNWCNKVLTPVVAEGETPPVVTCANPSCKFVIEDNDGNKEALDLVPLQSGINKAEVIFNDLQVQFNTTYVAHIEESCSGAKSDSIQFRRTAGLDDLPSMAPLKIDPVSGYTCMTRTASVDADSGTVFYETGFKIHLYYINFNTPPIIPPGTQNVFCHDIIKYGANDSSSFPRLELTPGVFNAWSGMDSRFYDTKLDPITGQVNGKIDIHDTISQIMIDNGDAGGLTFDIFSPFNWQNFPSLDDGSSGGQTTSSPMLGFVMSAFIDSTTGRSYCPKFADYNNPVSPSVIKAMKDVVGVDTEGIYLGVKEPESTTIDGTVILAPDDYIVIKESTLKNIWFYFENEQAIAPTELTEGTKTLHFYYPPNIASPYVQNADQRLYTVRHPSQLASVPDGGTSPNPTQVPHDKKMACAPVGE